MQPKKNDCTEKNLHTFIDKASTFFEKPTDRTAGCPDGRQSSPVRQKPRNTQKPGISEAI